MIRNGFLLSLILLLAGCAGMRIPGAPDTEREQRQVIELIDYTQRVATMSAEQQRYEYAASSQAFAKDKETLKRMRLALLLAMPGASFHDTARAASLLEPLAATGEPAGPLRSFARLFYAQLNERAGDQRRANQMREQLEALKAVERTILERGQQSLPGRK